MADNFIRDGTGRIKGRMDGDWLRDGTGKLVARYDKGDDRTRDRTGRIVGSGDQRLRELDRLGKSDILSLLDGIGKPISV